MDRPRPVPRLHVVTDDAVLARPDFVVEARRALEAGGADLALHIRGPHTSGSVVYRIAEALAETAESTKSLLVVNDRVDVALALGAAVHLGRRSLPVPVVRRMVGAEATVGCSAHGEREVEEATRGGVDYVFFGNVYDTQSHQHRPGFGLRGLGAGVEAASGTPLIGIGGVTTSTAPELRDAGAWGVAVLRGVWEAGEPDTAVRDYISALEEPPKMDGNAGA